jgi:HEPN domain-containing protein
MTPRLEAWLRQANDDLAMAGHALAGGFHAQACYHASQAAEKAIKGSLIGLGIEPAHTHSLERLVEDLSKAGVTTAPLSDLRLKALSRLATTTRYPAGDEAPQDLFDRVDAEAALATARAVLRFVEDLA